MRGNDEARSSHIVCRYFCVHGVGRRRCGAGAEDRQGAGCTEERPGAFIFIGNGDSAGLHHPAYNFNDEVIPVGTSYWVKLVETALRA